MKPDKFSFPRRQFIGGLATVAAMTAVAAVASAKSETGSPEEGQGQAPAREPQPRFPQPRFRHMDQEEWREVSAQDHAGKRVLAREKWLEFTPRVMTLVGNWDPGMIIAQHGHMCISTIYVVEGSMMCGDVLCTEGMNITLDVGTPYGPLIAGPEGVTVYQVLGGDPTPWYADPEGFEALKRAKGVTQLPIPQLKIPASAAMRDSQVATRTRFRKPYPQPRFKHMEEEQWREMRAQDHGGKRVSVREKWLEFTPRVMVFVGKWDPGMIVTRHGHLSINTIFVLEGSMTSDGVPCTKGMQITLDIGTPYGPIIAGPDGVTVYQVMLGDPHSWHADPEEFENLLQERGAKQLPTAPQTLPPSAST